METETRVTHMELPSSLAERYVELELVGQGGMGDVYRAMDRKLGRPVALKVVRADLLDQVEVLRRFRREVRAMQQVAHPNLVRFLDLHQAEGQRILIMEYVEGRTLESKLLDGEHFELDEALDCMIQCCEALQAIHDAGLLHRDVKPGNVMLGEDGIVRLMDFGLVRFEDSAQLTALTATGSFVGTARYIAPEVIRGAPPDALADVYALGMVFYECLTGRHPLDGLSLPEILSGEAVRSLEAPSALLPAVNEELDALLLSAMAPDPKERCPSARVFADGLRAWRDGSSVRDRTSSGRLGAIEEKESQAAVPGNQAHGRPKTARSRAPMRMAGIVTVLAVLLLMTGLWQKPIGPSVVLAPSISNLAVEFEGDHAILRYRSSKAMESRIRFERPDIHAQATEGSTPTNHVLRSSPLVEGKRHRFRILYPDGQSSIPHGFTREDPARNFRLEAPSTNQLLLRWSTQDRAQSRVTVVGSEGLEKRELDVFVSRKGRDHLLRLDGQALPLDLTRETKLQPGDGMTVLHRAPMSLGWIFGLAWKELPVLRAFRRSQRPAAFGMQRLPPPTWKLGEGDGPLLALLPAMKRQVAALLAPRRPLEERLAFQALLDEMACVATWAPDRELAETLKALAASRSQFLGPRLVDVESFREARSRATWSIPFTAPILLMPNNFDEEYTASLLKLVADAVREVPNLPSIRHEISVPEELADRPHELFLRMGNFDPSNCLRIEWNEGGRVHVVGRGKRNFDFIPFSAKRQRRVGIRTVIDYESHFPSMYYAVRIPKELVRPGTNHLRISAWALESKSMFFPGLGGLFLCPRGEKDMR